MRFFYINHNFKYEMDNICRLFISTDRMRDESDDFVRTEFADGEVSAQVCLDGKIWITSPWGILTGIRPVKLMRNIAAAHDEQYAIDFFREKFLVSEEKTALCYETMKNEDKILSLSRPKRDSV